MLPVSGEVDVLEDECRNQTDDGDCKSGEHDRFPSWVMGFYVHINYHNYFCNSYANNYCSKNRSPLFCRQKE
ncbi:hypothetical protein RHECIAT_CH0000504 [Rhizobium etli CIAT 652]|uniref:Uncharacterized protein n=1 Tax=Rhizobium etli (strain CIAT 652) TaxID=491916 RepID=B3Q065_RHIE6|nr:hypothetical protein RHECIAT_CH0000504 [Rhizobium etli CIAT 652]